MQNGFAEPASSPFRNPAALVDRLVNRFGGDAVTILQSRASHIPERAGARLPALEALAEANTSRVPDASSSPDPKSAMRPAFLLARPEPIDVTAGVPEDPPKSFIWRRVERRVARCEGPERIAPEWWRTLYLDDDQKQPRTRDYYKIEDHAGTAYWVFRHGLYAGEEKSGPPSWFLHGIFA